MYPAVSFRDAIRATGLKPPDVIIPGRLHRFPGFGKRPSNRAGWCKLFDDERAGCFGDWSSDFKATWHAEKRRRLFRTTKPAIERRRAGLEAERQAGYIRAAIRARSIWESAKPAPSDHPYLNLKRIPPHGARLHKNGLTLPVQDFGGNLTSLQFIDPEGSKRLLSGGRKRGCFVHVAGDIRNPDRIVVCEGWATGCTLATDQSDDLVIAAIDAGNLESVSISLRRAWPATELIIAGDDDRLTPGNPGATKAHAAAVAANAFLALPQWPESAAESLTDFNDLACWLAGEKP